MKKLLSLLLVVASSAFAQTHVDESIEGIKFGRSATEKLSFFGVTPVAQPDSANTAREALVELGLLEEGGADPTDFLPTTEDGALNDGVDVAVGTTTGTKIGTATAQKLGFHNATPVIQRAGADQAALGAFTAAALGGSLTGTLDNALADTPTLTDSPADADALRDDIHTNVKPVIDKNFKELQDELTKTVADLAATRTLLNELRASLVEKGLIKGAP